MLNAILKLRLWAPPGTFSASTWHKWNHPRFASSCMARHHDATRKCLVHGMGPSQAIDERTVAILVYGLFPHKWLPLCMHTTNYTNTFIEAAEDCPIDKAELPPRKDDKTTVANLHFDMIYDHPYQYTSDDIIFGTHAIRNDIPKRDWPEARTQYFSKGQACLRASPLGKRYGWGIHHDANSKVAVYPMESSEYKKFVKDKSLNHVKAMRSKR